MIRRLWLLVTFRFCDFQLIWYSLKFYCGLILGLICWIIPISVVQAQTGNITAVWANEGGDKVTRDELRASSNPGSVLNSVWDGSKVKLFGAKNEVVGFNLILEAANTAASNVTVSFQTLSGAGGATISSAPTSGDGVFNWVNRSIELFYIRYLEIKGLSTDLFFAGYNYDERHIPERFRRPWTGEGVGTGTWQDRPDHNKFYPDIAVPLELVASFDIAAGQNQSIWVDIYIPKTAPSGLYQGTVTIRENGSTTHEIPVELSVRNFTLPDVPNAKTMLFLGYEDINQRYLGEEYPDEGSANDANSRLIRDRHFLLAHRHRISLIDGNARSMAWDNDGNPLDQPHPQWLPRLDGSLFTAANGYDGPGVGAGNNVYSIGTYGDWWWQEEGEAGMRSHTDAWVNWFDANAPDTEYFIYLIDESDDFPLIQQWAQWINNNPGPGRRLLSMATLALPAALTNTPALDIPASWFNVGITSEWQNAVDSHANKADKRVFFYNSNRPASGSFATEDDGVALRVLAWGQYKKKIDRWFYWESTYYNNFQGNTGQTNVFQTAHTFGGFGGFDSVLGQSGGNYLNGDGVLFYPGTDLSYPGDSYGVKGPFASLRLKHWRRGIQDLDYLTLAAEIDPGRVQQIVDATVPKVLWEYGAADPSDPTWVLTDISWSTDPDDWEAARKELADIISGSTSVDDRNAATPEKFLLHQNYPNPFNPTTTITFATQQRGFVTLKVFNLVGEEVATLLAEELSPGEYSREWNARGVASGMYLYQLSLQRDGSSMVATKKLLLMK
ncbi:MAG: glycoside hydrolase domain-containing protein [bacterium]